MKKLVVSAFVFWMFLLAPGLCGAGVLAHACLCNETEACTHEELCSQDPCTQVGTRPGATDGAKVADQIAGMPALTVAIVTPLPVLALGVTPLDAGHTSRLTTPALPGNLPLLI